jgi:hypothetical protein
MLLPYTLAFASFVAGVLTGTLGVHRVLWILRVGFPETRAHAARGELRDPRRITGPFPVSIVGWTGVVLVISIWFVRETSLALTFYFAFGLVLATALALLNTRPGEENRRRFRQMYRNELNDPIPNPGADEPQGEQSR